VLGGEAGICHCSSATCAPFLANEALGGTSAVVRKGAFVAATDRQRCRRRGDCAKVCHFGARRIEKDGRRKTLIVDAARCYGCGLCAAVCQRQAIAMIPRKA
jgi:MinD superfamily P-loop ATPase